MNTYEVIYLDSDEKKSVHIYAKNKAEAGKAFASKYPKIKDANAILSVENMDHKSRDYGTAIGLAGFIAFLGWISVIVGVFLVFSGGFMIVGISGTISIIASGFMLIMGGQITRATANTANYSKQMLAEMRKGSMVR